MLSETEIKLQLCTWRWQSTFRITVRPQLVILMMLRANYTARNGCGKNPQGVGRYTANNLFFFLIYAAQMKG